MSFCYILRFSVDPGYEEDKALSMVMDFCAKAAIDDITFFCAPEELSQGHLTLEEQEKFTGFFRKAKTLTRERGMSFSINNWTTLYHTDRGRRLRPGQNFGLMVDVDGREATNAACPLDPAFRSYYADLLKRFGALHPWIFWIEDDFRLHNHDPLRWGGCFCERHMEEFSRRAGKTLSREEFIAGILRPGPPHPYRKVWLDSAREAMIDLAGIFNGAMREASDSTALGLMSSDPAVHCAEGRDWDRLLHSLCKGGALVNRPHLPAYNEASPQAYLWFFNTISLLSRACLPPETSVYPELENFPFARASKSLSFTRYQIETALALGSEGITLDILDFSGNAAPMAGHARNLAASKGFLSACNETGVFRWSRRGVHVLFSPDSSYTLHTETGRNMTELYPRENFWGGVFGSMGVPFVYDKNWKGMKGNILAVSGQFFRNLKAAELETLFADNFVILDGAAAETLFSMGAGSLAGIGALSRVPSDQAIVSYEELTGPEETYAVPRISAQGSFEFIYLVEYDRGARVLSGLFSPAHERRGNGTAVFNERVLILPYSGGGYIPMALNELRRRVLFRELQKAARAFAGPGLMALDQVNCGAYEFADGEKRSLFIINGSADPLDSLRLWRPLWDAEPAELLLRSGTVKPRCRVEGETLTLLHRLEPMECALLIFGSR
ncbi:MAG: hypothetical protein LBU00_05355 [Treponema sp.]|jgi:hypothetical protein|nr:hypothetical protein [Treponema sp.]